MNSIKQSLTKKEITRLESLVKENPEIWSKKEGIIIKIQKNSNISHQESIMNEYSVFVEYFDKQKDVFIIPDVRMLMYKQENLIEVKENLLGKKVDIYSLISENCEITGTKYFGGNVANIHF